jgi:hypothetical protein
MNCDDIAWILDERGIAALSPFEQADFDAHLACCSECAAQRLASERLQSFRSDVPPLPAALFERARQLHDLGVAAARERHLRRPVLVRSLMLLCAAATMFTAIPWGDTRAEPVK